MGFRLDRRSFVGGVVALVGSIMGSVAGIPAIGYIISPALKKETGESWVALGPAENAVKGVPTPFTFSLTKQIGWQRRVNTYTVYAVTDDGENFTVFSDACTHLGCKVHWDEENNAFICPCHDGWFDRDGEAIKPPVEIPLYRYENKLEEGKLVIKVEG